jgi:amino acid transporter
MTTETATDATHHLKSGSITPWGIVFMVLATAAPLTAMVTAMPLVVGFGNGVGAPGTYALVALTLALFAVGYSALSGHITNAGAFYAYITAGLGRPVGMAFGLIAVFAYNVLSFYVAGLIGFFAKATFSAELGIDLPWWLYAAVAMGIAVTLGILGIEVNVKALGLMLTIETGLLLIFDVVALAKNGLDVLPAASFSPSEVFSGAPGIAILFAVTCFIGFEATAIFGEEAEDPRRTVPKATYLAIATIGVLYVLTTWVFVGVTGGDKAGEVAAGDPSNFSLNAVTDVLGGSSANVVNWLVLTSILAVFMALHNMSARYLLAFGREGVLPKALARTHPTRQSPWVAGVTQAVITLVVVAIYALAQADPYLNLSTQAGGVGTLAVIMLMAMCSFSVPAYFLRRGEGVRPWHHVIAPVVAGLALTYFCYLIIDNYSLVTGSSSDLVNRLPLSLLVVGLIGLGVGLLKKQEAPLDAVPEEPVRESTRTV